MHSREFDSICTVRRNPLASLVARYCASIDIWPETYSATESGPCSSMIARSRRPASATASSTGAGTGSSARDARTNAEASRPSSAAIISAWVAPLVQSRPKLAGCNLSPDTFAMTVLPGSVVTSMPQPTPQYEHAVRVTVIRWSARGRGNRADQFARRRPGVPHPQEHRPRDDSADDVEGEEHPERVGRRLGLTHVGGAQHDVDEHAAERS